MLSGYRSGFDPALHFRQVPVLLRRVLRRVLRKDRDLNFFFLVLIFFMVEEPNTFFLVVCVRNVPVDELFYSDFNYTWK
jgi:hypothetical protein